MPHCRTLSTFITFPQHLAVKHQY